MHARAEKKWSGLQLGRCRWTVAAAVRIKIARAAGPRPVRFQSLAKTTRVFFSWARARAAKRWPSSHRRIACGRRPAINAVAGRPPARAAVAMERAA